MRHSVLAVSVVLLLATLPASAQAPDSHAPANSSTAKKKPKKVWTNDEIAKTSGTVSVVGSGNSPSGGSTKTQDPSDATYDPRQHQIRAYKEQLARLQSQMGVVDARISQLKEFKAENTSPSAGINLNKGYDMVPIADQIKQLEDKKRELRAKMDDIETDAHKNGITSDDLR